MIVASFSGHSPEEIKLFVSVDRGPLSAADTYREGYINVTPPAFTSRQAIKCDAWLNRYCRDVNKALEKDPNRKQSLGDGA